MVGIVVCMSGKPEAVLSRIGETAGGTGRAEQSSSVYFGDGPIVRSLRYSRGHMEWLTRQDPRTQKQEIFLHSHLGSLWMELLSHLGNWMRSSGM